ncbi:hypothetical protein AAG570_012601 [Ranatra chinensis]|uniref:G-protein coupled receptors family 1 profile domain-containing protein n=1 Tax=Ranatra chinensis TaxID=642074 RepID=A0ABD0YEB5_9HEMI
MGIFKNLSGGNNSWNLAEWLRDGGQYDACQHLLGVLDVFHTYYIPAIILLGLVGNLLSCIVFLNTHLRLRSSSYYLAALAVADFGFLAVLLLVWLNNNSGLRLFDKEGWCQCLVYLSSVCSFLSVWLIVAFTVERFIAVQYPLHRPHVCTVARAKAIVTGLVSFAFVSHGYSFVTAGLVRVHGVEVCELREGYDEAMRFISIVDSLMTLVLPLGLILLMNGMITRNLVNFGRGFKRDEPRSHVSSLSYRPSFRLNRLPTTVSTVVNS